MVLVVQLYRPLHFGQIAIVGVVLIAALMSIAHACTYFISIGGSTLSLPMYAKQVYGSGSGIRASAPSRYTHIQ